jgi:uncharacterized membrane protein
LKTIAKAAALFFALLICFWVWMMFFGRGSALGFDGLLIWLIVGGLFWFVNRGLRSRVEALEQRLAKLEESLAAGMTTQSVQPMLTEANAAGEPRNEIPSVDSQVAASSPQSGAEGWGEAVPLNAGVSSKASTELPGHLSPAELEALMIAEAKVFRTGEPKIKPPTGPTLAEHIKNWLFGGNTVARFGLIILFLGLSFLAKYAVDNDLFPIEARLAVIGIIAFALLIFGWRLRHSRASYGLLLQGGAVAALYLEIYTAFKFYHLISSPVAFALMILVCALATILALRQNALAMAVAATVGGFATPILASTGSGNHIALFSIYAVLNLSIFYIARLKHWRLLYLLGFVLTFGVTGFWVLDRYRPEMLQSTIGFVILFIALYSLIPVMDARRSTPNLKHYVDGTLVFGAPIAGFGILSRILNHLEYGIAFAALGLGAWYIVLAALGLKNQVQQAESLDPGSPSVRGLRAALVSYVALGAGFASLAIPLALEPRLAGIAWAIEGAALIWLGMRTHQALTRFAGVALQVFGLFIFFSRGLPAFDARPFLNPFWLGATMLAVSGYWSGWFFHQWKPDSKAVVGASIFARNWAPLEAFLAPLFALVAAALVVFSNTLELDHLVKEGRYYFASLLGLWTALAAAHAFFGRKLRWAILLWISLLLLPTLALMDVLQWIDLTASFADYRLMAWPLSMVAMTWILYQQGLHLEHQGQESRPDEAHGSRTSRAWVLAFSVLVWVASTLLLQFAQWQTLLFAEDQAWGIAAVGVALSLLLGLMLRLDWSKRVRGDSVMGGLHLTSLRTQAPMGLAWLLGLWFIFACTSDYGGLAIEPFLPLLNPIDLSASLALLSLIAYSRSESFASVRVGGEPLAQRHVQIALAAAAFLWLNTLLMRALSHYLDLPYRVADMLGSSHAQTSFSLLWAVTATAIMFFSTKRLWRSGWLVGAGLLAVVVIKLFLIDLSAISALTRIISFVGVGLLMLLIGYLSPLPPAAVKKSVAP